MSSYQAGDSSWLFPDLGEMEPFRSDAEVLLLTAAGTCIQGHWTGDPFYLAWAPLPKRDRTKEALVAEARQRSAEKVRADATGHSNQGGPATGARDSSDHSAGR